jgi:probable biosynthetic protein (TIGR04098 family)
MGDSSNMFLQDSYTIQSDLIPSEHKINRRVISINMPQMVLSGLSENWLYKELGDLHWEMITTGLSTNSSNLKDKLNNRLYSAFVRVRAISSNSFYEFQENEKLHIEGHLRRYGFSFYFSENMVTCGEKNIRVNMMTAFSARNRKDNKSLSKAEPYGIPLNSIPTEEVMPFFGLEHKQLKRNEKISIKLGGEVFSIHMNSIFTTEYKINPYNDLNGVNLLYFASYPTISDTCEVEFICMQKELHFSTHWSLESSTIARDIYYFGNCNIDDTIIYKVHSFERINNKVKIHSALFRKSDNFLIATLFTIKKITPY